MPNNIVTAKVEIVGIRSLFFHKFDEETIPMEKQELTGVAGRDPWSWARTTPIMPDGQLYLTPSHVFGSIRDGARHIKAKRGSLQPLVIATVQVVDEIILVDRFLPAEAAEFVLSNGKIGDPVEVLTRQITAPVYLDVRKGKNPSTKGALVLYRVAASPGWQLSCSLTWDKTVIATAQMAAILRDAGNLEGVGNGRKIGMGRYRVASFQVTESD
jgi:hypothetical protein